MQLATGYTEMTLQDAIKMVLETKSYKDEWGFGLTALEIANELGIQRDIVTAQMTTMGRSGVTEHLECKRNDSKGAFLHWLVNKDLKAVSVSSKNALKDRTRELCKFIRLIANKHLVNDPLQDILDIEDKARKLFPEF